MAAGFLGVCCAIPFVLAAVLALSTTAQLIGGVMAAAGIRLVVGDWMRHRRRVGRPENTMGMGP